MEKTISVRYDPITQELLLTDRGIGQDFDGQIFCDVLKIRMELSGDRT
jgi:hypothetical protein